MFVSESDSDTKVSKFIDDDGVHGDDDGDDYENKDDPNGSSGPHSMRKISKSNDKTKKKKKKKRKTIGDLIANAKKHLIRQNPTPNSKKGSSFSPPTPPPPSVSGNNRVVGTSSCFCFNPPCGLGSSAESHTSDPNHPDFTVDMLKTLIQTNEFYSNECNPHL